jgi:imidazolonepropionase-like amidohydrolase
VHRGGTVLVRDGRITAVGVDLAIPEGARILDARGKRVLPGFVAATGEAIGISGAAPAAGSRWADALDPFDRRLEIALGSGVTALHAAAPLQGPWAANGAVLRAAPRDGARIVLREGASLGTNYARASASDRLALEDLLRAGARHLREAEEAVRNRREPPRPSVPPEILAALRREIPIRVPASRKDEILDALRLAEDHGVRLVIEDALEAWRVAEPLARQGATALVCTRWKSRDPRLEEPNGGNIGVAGILERAGARFCLLPPGGPGTPGNGFRMGGLAGRDLMNLPIEGCFAVRGGAGEAEVLRSMTLGAAEALGVADRIGSIEPGKDADLILLDGDPLHYRTVVDVALVEGKVLYERAKSDLFRDLPGR